MNKYIEKKTNIIINDKNAPNKYLTIKRNKEVNEKKKPITK